VAGPNPVCRRRPAQIGNSAAERALRGVALGRRNFLFACADSGGERAAAVCGLIGTAKLNGVALEAWLRYVLERIAECDKRREFLIKNGISLRKN
jgi:hypothetical protein